MLAQGIDPNLSKRAMTSPRHSILCLVLLLLSGLPDSGLARAGCEEENPRAVAVGQPMYPLALRYRVKIFEQIAAGPASCYPLDLPHLHGDSQPAAETIQGPTPFLMGPRALYLLMSL